MDELQHKICGTITSNNVSELNVVSNDIFKRYEVHLRAEGRYLQHLL
jgi:hypothetical protein